MNKSLTWSGIVLILGLFLSCYPDKDPILTSDFKNLSQNDFIEYLTRKKALNTEYSINEFYDTLYFFNINNDKDLKSVLWVNPEDYYFENVNSVKINFGSDSVIFFGQMDYRPGKGFIDKSRLKKIVDIYQKYYGEPNFHFENAFNEFVQIDNAISEFKKSKIVKKNFENGDISVFEAGTSYSSIFNIYDYKIWELYEYKVMICSFFHKEDSTKVSGFIKYEVSNLDEILSDKREEIRKNASLDDYIEMDLNLDPFTVSNRQPYTDRLNVVAFRLGHILAEDPRDIKQFKFNLYVEDEYEDIILTVNDFELLLDYPLTAPRNGSFTATNSQYQWTVDYNRNASSSKEYENLRKIRERKIEQGRFSDIKLKYEITAIIFDDGTVLKK